MKKIVSTVLVSVLLSVLLVAFASCGSSERYNLVDIKFANATTDAYEYNYIEFDSEAGTYYLENEAVANGIVTKQAGTFTINGSGKVIFTNDDIPSVNYILYPNEEARFDGNKFRVEANIPGYGNVYMVFEK